MKKLLGLSIVTIGVVATIGILFGITLDDTQNNVQNVSESTTPIYIPSDITKANPNIIRQGMSQWQTAPTNIEAVKDKVIYTIQGTVLSIGDPIDRPTGIFYEYNEKGTDDYIKVEGMMGHFPITISVDQLYKGEFTSDEITFYLKLNKNNLEDYYFIFDYQPNFEVSEKILVHLGHSDIDFTDDINFDMLGLYGKYQINDDLAFNSLNKNGISIDQAAEKYQ